MRLTVIIKIIDIDLCKKSLSYLSNQSISDEIEVIYFYNNFDETSEVFKDYYEKFFDIKSIDNNSNNVLFSALVEATGEYVLVTDSNQLCYEYYSRKDIFENLYNTASFNDSDVLIYDINKKHADNQQYKFLDSLKDKIFDSKDINEDQLISLCDLDCDLLYSNKFKLFDSEYESINQLDIFKLKTLQNSKRIFLKDDFSLSKPFHKKLNIKENVQSIEKHDILYNQIIDNKQITEINKLNTEEFKPIISIIIPLYNPLTFDVLKSFYSILNQTFDFHNLEIIYVNDCSTYTNSMDIIHQITKKYPNIHLYNTLINSGSSIARNLGLNKANGKYIMFLDHDDYYMENACELLYNCISKEDVDVVSGNFYKVNNNEKNLVLDNNTFNNDIIFYENIDEKSEIMPLDSSIWAKIYSKKFLDNNEIRFNDFRIFEDKVFFYNILFTNSSIVLIDKPIMVHEHRDIFQHASNSKKLQYNLTNLLRVQEGLYYILELFEKHANEYKHIILDEVYYLTQDVLKNTPLTFDEFKFFVDKSLSFYKDYEENKNTSKYPDIERLINFLTKLKYLKAFNEYKQLNKNLYLSSRGANIKLSIIFDVYDKDILKRVLDNLLNHSLYDLEIICLKKSEENIANIIEEYREYFYNIKLIDYENKRYSFNKKITESNGSYTILTSSDNLSSAEYVNHINLTMDEVLKNDYEITLFNINRFKEERYNESLQDLIQIELNSEKLSEDDLYLLYQADCDVIIYNVYIYRTSDQKIKKLSYEPLTYMDLLINADQIYLADPLPEKKIRIDSLNINYNTNSSDIKTQTKERIKLLKKDVLLKAQEDEIILVKDIKIRENKKPKISIIIPTYNPKNIYIQILMISLFNQTFDFNELEIIFIDDQSKKRDGIKLIEKYTLEYPNIKLYQTPTNSGSGLARNIGLDNAQGKYIMFLDHDDYFFSNACEILYNTIKTYEDIQIVQGNYIVPEWGFRSLNWNDKGVTKYKTVTKTINEKYKCLKLTSAVWHMIIRKEFLDENNIRFGNYRISQDTLFHDNCLLRDCKAIFINEAIILYEQRKQSKDGEVSKTLETSLENLLTRFETRYEICKLYDDYAPDYKFVILDSVNYITEFLLNTFLTYPDFKKYVDISCKFYTDFLENTRTEKIPELEKFYKLIARKEYAYAYREYLKQSKN